MENTVGMVLRIIGFVEIAAGFIIGVILGSNSDPYGLSFNFSVFVSRTVTGFITGVLFIGFSEIIYLLQKINNQLQGMPAIKKDSAPDPNPASAVGKLSKLEINKGEPLILADIDKEKVMALYKNRKLADILPTPFEDYCIVQFPESDKITIIDVGGFKAMKSKNLEINQRIIQWHES